MSTLTKVLERNVAEVEKRADLTEGRYRLGHHLMPPVGWLNDPNGLCWFKGKYHVFFQYAPFEVKGGLKFWGHYTSENLVNWKYEGVALYPDSPYDCHGVYSGSALVDEDKLHLFYTGNVKIDGDYDYINTGRETSTLHVVSEDGIHFSNKEVAVSFEQYPEEHCLKAPELLREGGVGEDIIHSVVSHGYGITIGCGVTLDVAPEHEMEKVLFAADELTGLIGAVAVMRPSKSVMDLELKSVKKKYKNAGFAAGCSREVIERGADMLGWTVDDLIVRTIAAMRSCIELKRRESKMNIIHTKNAPAAVGPYSQAIVADKIVYTSGQIPLDPVSGVIEASDIVAQTKQVVHNLSAVLEAAGSSLDRVIKTTCFLKNIEDFAAFNAIYAEYFKGKPARSCVEVSNLPKGALVEIEAIAEI